MAQVKFFSPHPELLKSRGSIAYNDNRRASSTIRLKKEVIKEFPQLKDPSKSIIYQLVVCRKFEELQKELAKTIKHQACVPMLLFLGEQKL